MTALFARMEALYAVTGGPKCSRCKPTVLCWKCKLADWKHRKKDCEHCRKAREAAKGPAETSIRIADDSQKGGYYYAPVCRPCRAIAEHDRDRGFMEE